MSACLSGPGWDASTCMHPRCHHNKPKEIKVPEDNPLAGMLGFFDALEPILECAKGMKAKMEADGWSPSAAEDVAREFMVGAIRMSMK